MPIQTVKKLIPHMKTIRLMLFPVHRDKKIAVLSPVSSIVPDFFTENREAQALMALSGGHWGVFFFFRQFLSTTSSNCCPFSFFLVL